jgi:hypothetical protein
MSPLPDTTLVRFLYRWTVFMTLPGGLWAAFEMYGLTLGGPQMLFFSISHTMFPLVLAVWLSIPAGLLWLTQTIAAITIPIYRSKVSVHRLTLAIFFTAICFHATALYCYGSWSMTALRVPICFIGRSLTALATRKAWIEVRHAESNFLTNTA